MPKTEGLTYSSIYDAMICVITVLLEILLFCSVYCGIIYVIAQRSIVLFFKANITSVPLQEKLHVENNRNVLIAITSEHDQLVQVD